MSVNLNNFIIDRVLRGIAQSHTDDSVLFAITQIQNPSLQILERNRFYRRFDEGGYLLRSRRD